MRTIAAAAVLAVMLVGPSGGASSPTSSAQRSGVEMGAAGRYIGFNVISTGVRNVNTNKGPAVIVCQSTANGHIALTIKIRYCRVITNTGFVLRAVAGVVGVKTVATAGAGQVIGVAQTACIGITANYLGGVTLTHDSCGPLEGFI